MFANMFMQSVSSAGEILVLNKKVILFNFSSKIDENSVYANNLLKFKEEYLKLYSSNIVWNLLSVFFFPDDSLNCLS